MESPQTKTFTLLQLFSIIDSESRLSTNIDDVKTILSHLLGASITETDIPRAIKFLRENPPLWFIILANELKVINSMFEVKKDMNATFWDFLLIYKKDNFKELMDYIATEFNQSFPIPPLPAYVQESFWQ